MSAKIIPFGRAREAAPAPPADMPPAPVVSQLQRFRPGGLRCTFIGSRESLLAWRVCTENEFPQGRKRVNYNQRARPSVKMLSSAAFDVYEADFHLVGDDPSLPVLEDLLKDILAGCGEFEAAASKSLRHLVDLRLALLFGGNYYNSAQVRAFDQHVSALERVVAAALRDRQACGQRTNIEA